MYFRHLCPCWGTGQGPFHHLILSITDRFPSVGVHPGRMVVESQEKEQQDCSFRLRSMFILAVATSIDALAAGITLIPETNIITAVVLMTQ